jgi:hypothetical protein
MSFLELWEKFTAGLSWIMKKRNMGIDISKDEARFELDVVIPMDLAWQRLSEEEKDKFLLTM